MVKFYYVSVSNSAKKRLAGSISAEAEKEAREKLNKVGMAILSISSEKISEWDEQHAFEFSVTQKNDEELSGEILAEGEIEVFDRLAEEFEFKRINYIYKTTASEEEKMKAREKSVKDIIERKEQEDAQKEDMEKRTFSGGLKSLVKLTEKEKQDEEARRLENLKKFSSEGEEDLAKKTAADVADSEKPDAQDIKKVNLSEDTREATESEKKTKTAVNNSLKKEDKKDAEVPKTSFSKKFEDLKTKLKDSCSAFTKKAGRFYFLLTEIVVPPKGSTRKDGLKEMKTFLFPPILPKDHAQVEKEKGKIIMKRKAIVERFWISLEETVDVLAAVFLAYFAIGMLALHIEIPRVSELAAQTLNGNFMIPFLAGSFIFLRLLILLREKFTSWSPMRTSILFLTGGVMIVFAGMNLL
jgi:hypothetical protein